MSVVSDIDIYSAAIVLIAQHGEGASLEAALRADAQAATGNREGCETWAQIMLAVDELQRTERFEGEPLN
jgi:hypothetical protein